MAVVTITDVIIKGHNTTLVVDGEAFACLDTAFVMLKGLKKGAVVEASLLAQYVAEAQEMQCFDALVRYLGRGIKCKKDCVKYLRGKEYPAAIADVCIAKGEEYGYIDDSRFAGEYVRAHLSNSGRHKLEYNLQQYGINNEIIRSALEENLLDREEELALAQAEKLSRGKSLDEKTRAKLYRSLYAKGYDNAIIMRVLTKCGYGSAE